MTSETGVADPDQTRGPEADEAEDFPEAVVDSVSQFLGKPRARGWIHVYAAAVAAIAGTALVSVSWSLQGFRAGIDQNTATLLPFLDGSRTLREAIELAAASRGVDSDDLDAFRSGAVEIARTMLELGFLALGDR